MRRAGAEWERAVHWGSARSEGESRGGLSRLPAFRGGPLAEMPHPAGVGKDGSVP